MLKGYTEMASERRPYTSANTIFIYAKVVGCLIFHYKDPCKLGNRADYLENPSADFAAGVVYGLYGKGQRFPSVHKCFGCSERDGWMPFCRKDRGADAIISFPPPVLNLELYLRLPAQTVPGRS